MAIIRDRKNRILLAEDEAPLREMLLSVLKRCGFEVDEAEDGGEAMRVFEQNAAQGDGYDLLAFDINMPNCSGIDLLRRLRLQGVQTPALLLSGDPSPQLPEGDALAADVLAKPFRLQMFIDAVGRAIGEPAAVS